MGLLSVLLSFDSYMNLSLLQMLASSEEVTVSEIPAVNLVVGCLDNRLFDQ